MDRREIPIPNNRSDTRRNAECRRVMVIDLYGMVDRGDLEPKASSYVRRPPFNEGSSFSVGCSLDHGNKIDLLSS